MRAEDGSRVGESASGCTVRGASTACPRKSARSYCRRRRLREPVEWNLGVAEAEHADLFVAGRDADLLRASRLVGNAVDVAGEPTIDHDKQLFGELLSLVPAPRISQLQVLSRCTYFRAVQIGENRKRCHAACFGRAGQSCRKPRSYQCWAHRPFP